ncbi:MAG: caib/baif family protein [Myxococcaceae bacterium]|nr:caib/baif family protein [Myxococcaceae bacterium]
MKTSAVERAPAREERLEGRQQEIAGLNKRDFLDALARLTKGYSTEPGNPGSYNCVGCTRCSSCMFCRDCDSCYACNYCVRCELCTNCSHCVDSKNCQGCAYCVQSEHCTQSAYLVMCRNLSDCNYCFGCVGLQRKDFYILNVPFTRTEYFKIVGRLKKELGLS